MAKLTRLERACLIYADEAKDHRKWSSWLPVVVVVVVVVVVNFPVAEVY
jgi:predicted transposase YdaD